MRRTAKSASPGTRLRRVVAPLLLLVLLATLATPAAAVPPAEEVIVLPGASSAEGIAAGRGTTFYAGDLLQGDIFRGDVRRGTAALFIDAPAGRLAVGMATSNAHQLLFVAGGFTGQGYVYDTASGATVASYQLADPAASFVNDVTVTNDGPGSPTRCRPSCTSSRSAGRGFPDQPGHWRSAAQRPTPAASSTSTASPPPPTARP